MDVMKQLQDKIYYIWSLQVMGNDFGGSTDTSLRK